MNGSFRPAWLWIGVVVAAIGGIAAAVWLFAALASSGG